MLNFRNIFIGACLWRLVSCSSSPDPKVHLHLDQAKHSTHAHSKGFALLNTLPIMSASFNTWGAQAAAAPIAVPKTLPIISESLAGWGTKVADCSAEGARCITELTTFESLGATYPPPPALFDKLRFRWHTFCTSMKTKSPAMRLVHWQTMLLCILLLAALIFCASRLCRGASCTPGSGADLLDVKGAWLDQSPTTLHPEDRPGAGHLAGNDLSHWYCDGNGLDDDKEDMLAAGGLAGRSGQAKKRTFRPAPLLAAAGQNGQAALMGGQLLTAKKEFSDVVSVASTSCTVENVVYYDMYDGDSDCATPMGTPIGTPQVPARMPG